MNLGESVLDWIVEYIFPWLAILFIVAIFGLFVGIVALAFQPNTDPVQGVIVEKHYSPEGTEPVLVGKARFNVHHNESWRIKIYNDGKTASIPVSQSVFESIKIGNYYGKSAEVE